jgi:putative DNA methylase
MYKKKLIEVALPLEAINKEAAREKSIRHGHPSTLHLWWARRPLAACRAVLFAQIVDDPSAHPEKFKTEAEQNRERKRLFSIIEEMVKWENINNEKVLAAAREEIIKSTGGNPPPVYDPFCGGGSIPLEAQRLGMEAYGSDLNPVPVLITKALIEIPPKFAGQKPKNPAAQKVLAKGESWKGAAGLAEDVRYYGQWMRDEAEKKIGHLYPKIKLPKKYGEKEATVIAWIWTRTVKCPNPACGATMPLVRSFWLSTKTNHKAWIEPKIDKTSQKVSFIVHNGSGVPPEGTVNRKGGRCIVCGSPVPFEHIRKEGKERRMSAELMAIVAEGDKGRVYASPDDNQVKIAHQAKPKWKPDVKLPHNPRDFKTPNYGMTQFSDLFTPRQLVALTTFSDLIQETHAKIRQDAIAAGMKEDGKHLEDGGISATAYADAVATYLAFAVSKQADLGNSLCRWEPVAQCPRQLFGRQAIPMIWDYAESNPLGNCSGSFFVFIEGIVRAFANSFDFIKSDLKGVVTQENAVETELFLGKIVSTDPPYYDNISYADLSDFFYVWLRRSLKPFYTKLLSTLTVPKTEELIATPYRHGCMEKAETFFLNGMTKTMSRLAKQSHPEFPVTIYYAFKQSENDEENGFTNTGWDTFLEAVVKAGFSVTGTWPMRTENDSRLIGHGTNALASSIVLVCRRRKENAILITRRDFLTELKSELATSVKQLQKGNIAPVDLAQAAIGPGMAVFSRYSKVIEADGKAMTVRAALGIINQVLDETLAELEGEFDADTRWALAWYSQYGFEEGPFGDADNLSRAKNTSVEGLVEAGFLESNAGKVKLIHWKELPEDWDPATDDRLTIWETTHHLIRIHENDGQGKAGELVSRLGSLAETSRDLAYRLYNICERKNRTQDALAYNGLVIAWPQILKDSQQDNNHINEEPQQELGI